MKEIPLTQGKYTVVDDKNFEWLMQWKWYFANGYACRMEGRTPTFMHREILEAPPDLEVDHIDHNGLNNTEDNIRLVPHHVNRQNRPKPASGYLGVTLNKQRGTDRARIKYNGTMIELGTYDNAIDAAKAYDEVAIRYHGLQALTNFPQDETDI